MVGIRQKGELIGDKYPSPMPQYSLTSKEVTENFSANVAIHRRQGVVHQKHVRILVDAASQTDSGLLSSGKIDSLEMILFI